MRIVSFTLGLICISSIIAFGYYTNINAWFVIWFGVITAILSPLAFEFLLFPFRARNQNLINDLSRVPKIDLLIKEAKDNEERIKILLRQKQELDKLIAYESKRRGLEAEKEMFILQGKEAIKGLNRVNQDLTTLTEEKQKLPEVLKPLLGNIYGDNKDVLKYSINGTWYALKRSSFATFPIYGPLIFDFLKIFERLFESVDNRKDNDE